MSITKTAPVDYFKHELDHRGTHYVLFTVHGVGVAPLFALETGWGSYYGQWIALSDEAIHWNYLTEKMPALRDGDYEGWKLIFAECGVEIFGGPTDD